MSKDIFLNVRVNAKMLEKIDQCVKNGIYDSRTELIRDGIKNILQRCEVS